MGKTLKEEPSGLMALTVSFMAAALLIIAQMDMEAVQALSTGTVMMAIFPIAAL